MLFCFKYQTYLQLVPRQGGVYLLTMDTEFGDVTAPYLYVYAACLMFRLSRTERRRNRPLSYILIFCENL